MALICGLTPASASDGRSSPEDLQRFVSVAHGLEQAPLNQALRADREWALSWLTEAPDVSVTICTDSLSGFYRTNYEHGGQISLQNMFSIAAFMIEHPEKSNDSNAQQVAGVEGALNAYRAILRDQPGAKSPALESLLQAQARGELPELIREALIRCSKTRKK